MHESLLHAIGAENNTTPHQKKLGRGVEIEIKNENNDL